MTYKSQLVWLLILAAALAYFFGRKQDNHSNTPNFDHTKFERHVIDTPDPIAISGWEGVKANQVANLRTKNLTFNDKETVHWPEKYNGQEYFAEEDMSEGDRVSLVYYIPIQKPGVVLSPTEMENLVVKVGVIKYTGTGLK